jgi:hypothetical protein
MICEKTEETSAGADDAVKVVAEWRLFYSACPRTNTFCSNTSSAYVAAITVCRQALFTGQEASA